MSKPYAVFLDIDNTLTSGGEIHERNIAAINKARKAGNYVFINTARSHACIPDIVTEKIQFDGIVAGIGTDIRIGSERIVSRIMPKDELKELARYFMGTHKEVAFEGEDKVLWINPEEKRQKAYYLHSPDEFDTVYKEEPISKMYIKGQLMEEEKTLFGRNNIVFQHAEYAEFVAEGFGKAQGMLKVLEHLRIPVDHCIAMGDSSNDADMLLAAGISVAMGNAIEDIKNICSFISIDAKDGGVGYALEKLILGKETVTV